MAAALGRVDALVFTGGIGEHDARLRSYLCGTGNAFLWVGLDDGLNDTCIPDADISKATPVVNWNTRVLIIHTREDVSIVREVQRVLHP